MTYVVHPNDGPADETRLSLTVPPGQHTETRLDVYLTQFLPNVTRTKVQQGIKAGRVMINGRVVKKGAYIVQSGDEIVCQVPRPPPLTLEPEAIPLDVVHEDAHLLVVNKPAGMVVHPAYGHRTGTLVHALLYHLGVQGVTLNPEEEKWTEDVPLSTQNAGPRFSGDPTMRPGLVHRLDKDTSGLMVVAKTDAAHAHLAAQFHQRTIQRTYHALVWGTPDPPEGTIETHLGRDPRDRKKMAVVAAPKGKFAQTHYRAIEVFQYHTLLEFRLATGRTHQIRVHAQHRRCPVLGDPTYGGQAVVYGPKTAKRRAFFANLFKTLPRQALHARTLGFVHPHTEDVLHFTTDLPTDMATVLTKIRQFEGLPDEVR